MIRMINVVIKAGYALHQVENPEFGASVGLRGPSCSGVSGIMDRVGVLRSPLTVP